MKPDSSTQTRRRVSRWGLLTVLQLSGVSQKLRAILRGDGNVMPPPMEETREGLLGPDTPDLPDWGRTADAEGFPQTATRRPTIQQYR